jgi:lipopolysaccharide export system protein LptA
MQGQNVLKGDRLVIDLKTGESRFENTGNTAAGGRIRALFMPKDAPADAKPDDDKPRDGSEPAGEKPAASPEQEEPLQLVPEHQ